MLLGRQILSKLWPRKQRNRVRKALRAWESIQADILPKRSRTVDRRVRSHQRVLDKWNDALQRCSPPGNDDDYDSGNLCDDPYGCDDDDTDLGGFVRVTDPNDSGEDPNPRGR